MNFHFIFCTLFAFAYISVCSASNLGSYIVEQTHLNKPVSMEKVLQLAEQGDRVDGLSLAYIFKSIKEDQVASVAQTLKCNGFQMCGTAFTDICLSAPSLSIVLSVSEVFDVSELITTMNLPFAGFLECFLDSPEDYGNRLQFLVSHGLGLSPIETFILEHLGLHVSPCANRDLVLYGLTKALKLIKHQDFCCSPVFIDMVINSVCEQSQSSLFPCRAAYEFRILYASIKDTNGEWLRAIIGAGIEINLRFLIAAIFSGEECNLMSVLSVVGGKIINSNVSQLLTAYAQSNFKDESHTFQDLFQRLLGSYELIADSNAATDMLNMVLSRPSFIKILHKHSPQFFADVGKIRLNDYLFLTALTKGFEGPDLFLELSGLQLGSWFTGRLYHSINPDLIVSGLQYLMHQGKYDSADFEDIAPLHVIVSKLEILSAEQALILINAFLEAGVDVNAKLYGKSPLDIVLQHTNSPVQVTILSLLIKAGASIDHVTGSKLHRLIRMALWHTSIQFILEGLKDSGSNIFQATDGLDVAHVFNQAILGFEQKY